MQGFMRLMRMWQVGGRVDRPIPSRKLPASTQSPFDFPSHVPIDVPFIVHLMSNLIAHLISYVRALCLQPRMNPNIHGGTAVCLPSIHYTPFARRPLLSVSYPNADPTAAKDTSNC